MPENIVSAKDTVEEIQPEVTINYRKIQSLVDAHFIYDGQVSKRHYEWIRGGAIVDVDERDIPELLAKRLGGKTCCGNPGGNVIFKLTGD